MANWSSLSTRVRIGGTIYNNTLAIGADSNDVAIVWFTWNRATRSWTNEGHVFNRSFYRGYGVNSLEDTIRFVVTTKEYSGGDSVLCAYRNKGATGWTEGPAFRSSTVSGTIPTNAALTYIESSRRLVLFYTQSNYALDDSLAVYMRYWKTSEGVWSSPVKISRGDSASAFVTACRVPVTHGDVCYVAYERNSVVGGTQYHYADLAKVSFVTSGDTIPPGRIEDLGAQPGPAYGEAALSWTAPGNDGYIGTADHYIVRVLDFAAD